MYEAETDIATSAMSVIFWGRDGNNEMRWEWEGCGGRLEGLQKRLQMQDGCCVKLK